MAPASTTTGVGLLNFKESITSETLKSSWNGSGILINFETRPFGIYKSQTLQVSSIDSTYEIISLERTFSVTSLSYLSVS